jgi:N6-adenosine-specific RNA methylase IME4
LKEELEVLETKIYKEGRVKRNRQGLLDVTTSKLKANSEQFDELYNLTVRLCKDYNKLGKIILS